MKIKVLDIECYINYFLVNLRGEDGVNQSFTRYNESADHTIDDIKSAMSGYTIVTFNGTNYDFPMLSAYFAGATNVELKELSDEIVKNDLKHWSLTKRYGTLPYHHIDIVEVLPGVAIGLKLYGARIGTKTLQELPIHPDNIIFPKEAERIAIYCQNDCQITLDLFNKIRGEIDLRSEMSKRYGVNLMSKSDAQIAEAVVISEVEHSTGLQIEKPSAKKSYRYKAPSFIFFQTDRFKQLKELCESVEFKISDKGAVLLPKELSKTITVAGKEYKLGIGGLHSVDTPASYHSDADHIIYDIDVASYYPNLILNGKFFPTHIPGFEGVYRSIVNRRMEAKRKGDKVVADSLKITVNGSFGKFGSKYSKLYSPDLMFHTTVSGQLALFMLIELFEIGGITVISANTDGLTLRLPRNLEHHLRSVVSWWEKATNLQMEYAEYKSVHYRDVNNYIAVKPDGKIKTKGVFAEPSMMKNPANPIIYMAVVQNAANGTPIRDTIMGCKDITQFLECRRVTGGAVILGEYLGSVVRWYHSTFSDHPILTVKKGDKVANSDNAMPMMVLRDTFPEDVDYEFYINAAEALMKEMK